MQRHLDLPSLSASEVQRIVNEKRELLGLTPVTAVSLSTQLAEGIEQEAQERVFDKASALRDVDAFTAWIDADESYTAVLDRLRGALEAIAAQEASAPNIKIRSLVQSGLELAIDADCPLCDTEWESPELLRRHLAEKLEGFKKAAQLVSDLDGAARDLRTQVDVLRELVKTLVPHAASISGDLRAELRDFGRTTHTLSTHLGGAATTQQQRDRIVADPLMPPPEITQHAFESCVLHLKRHRTRQRPRLLGNS